MKLKWYAYPVWVIIGALTAVLLNYIFNITGMTSLTSFTEAESGLFSVSDSVPVLVILYCFITPLAEEVIFRYLLFNFLSMHIKKAAVAIIITAVLFGIYHINPVQMLYGFLMGLLITYSYYRCKDLTIPFLVHASANAVGLLFALL